MVESPPIPQQQQPQIKEKPWRDFVELVKGNNSLRISFPCRHLVCKKILFSIKDKKKIKKHHILHLLQIHQDLSIHVYVFFSALVLCTVFAFVFVFLHLCVCPSVPYLYFCECFLLLLYLFIFVFLHLCVFSLLLYCISCFSDNLTPLLCGRQLTVKPEYKY